MVEMRKHSGGGGTEMVLPPLWVPFVVAGNTREKFRHFITICDLHVAPPPGEGSHTPSNTYAGHRRSQGLKIEGGGICRLG